MFFKIERYNYKICAPKQNNLVTISYFNYIFNHDIPASYCVYPACMTSPQLSPATFILLLLNISIVFCPNHKLCSATVILKENPLGVSNL